MLHPFNPNIVVFPHLIYGSKLENEVYDWNNVNGGARPIGAFGLSTNSFFGGRSIILGYIKELGFWGCQDKNHKENLIGFYLQDPDTITELGKRLIEQKLSQYTVQYVNYEDVKLSREETKALLERFKNAKQKALDLGYSPQVILHADVGTLEGLIDMKSFESQREGDQEKTTIDEISIIENIDTVKPKAEKKPVPKIKIATKT